MAIIIEGKTGIVVASRAWVVEDSRELAWAEPFVRRAPDIKFILGNYVQTSTEQALRYNSNGHLFGLVDTKEAIKDIPHRPLNYLHIPNRRIGTFAAAEFVWPTGENAAEPEPPIVEALSVFWSVYDEGELWPSIAMAHRDGTLWYSMEAMPEKITCMDETCNQTYRYAGPGSSTYCAHLQKPRSKKMLHKPRFTGGALIVPPVRPGWVNADVKEISRVLDRDTDESDRLCKEMAAESPGVDYKIVEEMVYQMLAGGEMALQTEIPADGGFQTRPPLRSPGKSSEEVPNNHPAEGGPVTPDSGDPVIPDDGGFEAKPALHLPDAPHVQEIPDNHPPAAGKSVLPIDWAAAATAKAAINYGVDTSGAWSSVKTDGNGAKGKPDYSGDTTKAWSKGKALPKSSAVPGAPDPKSAAYAAGSGIAGKLSYDPGDPKGLAHGNKTPRSSMASDSDPTTVAPWDSPQMSDGTFSIAQPGDVVAAIAKVQGAESVLPPRAGRFQDIKNHIAKRAEHLGLAHLVPADWQLSMAMQAAEEIARSFSPEERQALAKEGKAMSGGGYPIKSLKDLDNAIRAYGREPEAKRASLKAHLYKQARVLKAGPAFMSRIAALGKSASK
jgi:hypothetical protein